MKSKDVSGRSLLPAAMGPMIPLVPVGDFTKFTFKKSELETLWSVVGPSAMRNIVSVPLWQVIALAYMEGLDHGHGLAKSNGGDGLTAGREGLRGRKGDDA